MNRGPIFVGGLDRSGKTLMRLSLSAHPNLAMTRRTYMWTRVYNRYGNLRQRDNFERCLAAILRERQIGVLRPDPQRIRREFWQGEPTYARLFALFHAHYAEQVGKPRWGDQLGSIERYTDPIFAAYPDARMIHMIRDPRDRHAAAVSNATRRHGKVGLDTARWLASAVLAQRNQQRYPDRYTVVRYEEFVARREQTLRAICAFIDEAYTPTMLTLEGAMRFGDEDDEGDDGPEQEAAASANRPGGPAIPEREIAFIQAYAGHEMAAFGYQPRPLRLPPGERLLLYLLDWPVNLAHMVAWRAREVPRLV
jgi:hypothetical protein